MQLGGQLLHALGERIAGALEFVLSGLHVCELFELGRLFGGQGLAAAVVFQGLLGVEYLLVQRFGLRLGSRAVGAYRLLGLELAQLLVQALLLITQRGAIRQRLQGRWVDVTQVNGQTRCLETLTLEAVEHRFKGFHPQVAVVQLDATLTQWQAEQGAVEQAHQAVDILLRELFAQAGVTVVVGVVELLLDLPEAFFQVANALVEVFDTELTGLGQGACELVMGILGRQQLLLQHLDVIDQGKTMAQYRQLAQPALDAGDFTLKAHQLLCAAALVVLQAVLFTPVMFGLDDQLFLARHGVVLPGTQQVVEHR